MLTSAHHRRSRRVATALAVAAISGAAITAATPAAATSALKPGLVGSPITVGRNLSLSNGYADMATSNGTTYAAWLASSPSSPTRELNLCVLPPNATACFHGVQTTSAIDGSTAAGLHVLMIGGTPTLIWQHATVASESGPHSDGIAEATVNSAGVLGEATDVATAPSFGTLLDAEVSPTGQVWVLTSKIDSTSFEAIEGLANPPVTVTSPKIVTYAHVAWDHGTAIIAVTQPGTDVPVLYSSSRGTTFPSFKAVPHTGSIGIDIDLVNAGGHVRLISGRGGDADYEPVVTAWNGHGFPAAQHTGYPAKPSGGFPSSHDGVTDPSGRLVDVSDDDGTIAIGNLGDDVHAAYATFNAGGTVSGAAPQVSTSARGFGWAMWGVEDTGAAAGTKLRIQRFLLPGLRRTVTKKAKHGQVALTGPKSCLPPTTILIHGKGYAKKGWKAAKAMLKLAGKTVHTSINGAALAAGKTYTLSATVVFENKKHHHKHSEVTAKLTFRSCPN